MLNEFSGQQDHVSHHSYSMIDLLKLFHWLISRFTKRLPKRLMSVASTEKVSCATLREGLSLATGMGASESHTDADIDAQIAVPWWLALGVPCMYVYVCIYVPGSCVYAHVYVCISMYVCKMSPPKKTI